MDNDDFDFTQPQDLTLEDTAPSVPAMTGFSGDDSENWPAPQKQQPLQSDIDDANGQSSPRNPLLPPPPGDMAALDGNQPFKFYNSNPATDSMLDDLTVPKDISSKTGGGAGSSDPSAGMNALNSYEIADTGTSNPAPGVAAGARVASETSNGNKTTSTTEDDGVDAIQLKADRLSAYPSVNVGGKQLSINNFDNETLYNQAIVDALRDNAPKPDADKADSQNVNSSQDEFKNPGPIPGLRQSSQALVDASYKMAVNPTARVGEQPMTERSRYYSQDAYRRSILLGLLTEMHGGWEKIPDSELRLVNPDFDPNLAATGREFETGRKILENTLAGGVNKAVEIPEAVKSGYDFFKSLFGD